MGRLFPVISTLFLLCGFNLGQSSPDRVVVFGGYSLVTSDFTGTFADGSTHILNGWDASASFQLPGCSASWRMSRDIIQVTLIPVSEA